MTLQLTRYVPFPQIPHYQTAGSPGFASILSINGSLHKFMLVVSPPKVGSIRKVHWRTTNITAAGTDPLDVRIETVDAAGLPSGTLWAANTNVAYPIGAANTWQVSTLTADAVITDTDVLIAVVISNPVANFSNFQMASITSVMSGSAGRPYQAMYTTSWAVQNVVPVLALEYSDGSFEYTPGLWPILDFTSINVASTSTPDEVGIRFQLPFRSRCRGFWIVKRFSASSADLDIVLYNAAGTATLVKSLEAEQFRSPTGSEIVEEIFDSTLVLEPNTFYRLAYRPSVANSGEAIYMGVDSVGLMAAMPGGADCYWTERTDAGTWTDNTSRWPLLGVLLDQFSDDIGSAGASLIAPRVMVA